MTKLQGNRQFAIALCAALAIFCVGGAEVKAVDVVSGQTSVLLDTATLSAAASLDLSGTSSDVTAGNLGAGSVAFAINSRTAAARPTTFSYDPATFPAGGSFSGTIEHTGSVFFNSDTVEVGDFSIGFDASRVGSLSGSASGFFVESTTGINAILFDLAAPSQADALPAELTIAADLLVSPEFAGFLQTNSLATSDLSGADVGDALVEAVAVPEPTSGVLLLLAATAFSMRSASRS